MCLEIRKRSDCLGGRLPMLCEGHCEPPANKEKNMGNRVVFLAGRPTVALCASCAASWGRWWSEADSDYRDFAEAA